MKVLLSTLILGAAAALPQDPPQAPPVQLRVNRAEIGCLTGTLNRLDTDTSLAFRPDPAAPGHEGLIVTVSPAAFRRLLVDMTGMTLRCAAAITGVTVGAASP